MLLERPARGGAVKLKRAFPNLSIGAIGMVQRPGDGSRWYIFQRVGRICNVPPLEADPSSPRSRLVVPGDPSRSLILTRMITPDAARRMPPVGTKLVDEEGAAVIEAWIRSLADCP